MPSTTSSFSRPHRLGRLLPTLLLLTPGSIALAQIRAVPSPVPSADPRFDTQTDLRLDTQTDFQIQNLRAFARLYGYVRYFHPSDEAADLDWEAFAVVGAREVKDAATPEEMEATLERLFLPIAPTVRIYREADGPPPAPPEISPADTAGLATVAWQHLGVGFGNANSVYRSGRLNRPMVLPTGATNAFLRQCLEADPVGGTEVRLTGLGRALAPEARVQLWVRVDLESGGYGFLDAMEDRPLTAPDWAEMVIQGPVDPEASQICFGAIVLGGEAALDDLRLSTRDGAEWISRGVVNGGFEEGDGESIPGWISQSQGWRFSPVSGGAPSGDRYLRAIRGETTIQEPLFEFAPKVGEVAHKPLARGLMAAVPLALYSRDQHTLGRPDPGGASALSASLAGVDPNAMTAEDEDLRLGDVVMAWNVFQHFYPYFDVVEVDWDGVLTTALERARSDATPADFLATLRWMVSRLQDGHGYVSGPTGQRLGLPIALGWVEGRVVVVASDVPERVQTGDVVETIDGRPAAEEMYALAETFSGSPQWRRRRALGQLGWGTPQSEVALGLRRGDEAVPVTLTREATQPPEEPRPNDIQEVEPGIFYVNLDRVQIDSFRAKAEEMAQARGVVFDLRGYPNGNHEALTYLTDENLNSAFWRVPEIIYPDGDGEPHYRESRWDLPPSRPRFRGKIVFLTDGRAISYAESVMGIVEAYHLGEIVGSTTAGANGNVNPFTLPGGYRFSWTGMKVVKHDGSQHHLVGIRPTIPMTPTIQGIRDGRDELLERAVEVIRSGR